jgi:tetratricopeptide (TPR) repeat protein
MWGMVAFGLLILFLFVGYQAAMRVRGPNAPVADTRDTHDRTEGALPALPPRPEAAESAAGDLAGRPSNPDAPHKRLRAAAAQRQYTAAINYGQQIYASGNADPDDLLIIAQSYFSMGDCPNTLTWVDRANDAFHAAAREPGEIAGRMTKRCLSGIHNAPIPLTAAQCEHMRLPDRYKPAAEAQSKLGQAYVNLGETYYGFGDYQRAITAIECGLTIGQVTHLDDAYVYLGRSFVAIDNVDEARSAFAKLKQVPNISPRVLLVWELYADTL